MLLACILPMQSKISFQRESPFSYNFKRLRQHKKKLTKQHVTSSRLTLSTKRTSFGRTYHCLPKGISKSSMDPWDLVSRMLTGTSIAMKKMTPILTLLITSKVKSSFYQTKKEELSHKLGTMEVHMLKSGIMVAHMLKSDIMVAHTHKLTNGIQCHQIGLSP